MSTDDSRCSTLLSMLEAAGRDERLATGQLYLDAKARIEELEKRLGGINTIACYASEENTDARVDALLMIGRIARGEGEVTWPII